MNFLNVEHHGKNLKSKSRNRKAYHCLVDFLNQLDPYNRTFTFYVILAQSEIPDL